MLWSWRITNFQWNRSPAAEMPPSLFSSQNEATQGQKVSWPPLVYTLRPDAVSSTWLLSSRASMHSGYSRQLLLWTPSASLSWHQISSWQTVKLRSRTAPFLHQIFRNLREKEAAIETSSDSCSDHVAPCLQTVWGRAFPDRPAGFKPRRSLGSGFRCDALRITFLHSKFFHEEFAGQQRGTFFIWTQNQIQKTLGGHSVKCHLRPPQTWQAQVNQWWTDWVAAQVACEITPQPNWRPNAEPWIADAPKHNARQHWKPFIRIRKENALSFHSATTVLG